jgi:hypothetical protein
MQRSTLLLLLGFTLQSSMCCTAGLHFFVVTSLRNPAYTAASTEAALKPAQFVQLVSTILEAFTSDERSVLHAPVHTSVVNVSPALLNRPWVRRSPV